VTNQDTLPDRHGDLGAEKPGHRGPIVVFSRDLIFIMRIRTTLRHFGYVVSIAQDAPAFTIALTTGEPHSVLGLIDFNQPIDWAQFANALESAIPVIAFGPHKDVEGFRAAKQAGVTRVVANGEFTRSLPQLVERYARQP